jgi:hypothetical protein
MNSGRFYRIISAAWLVGALWLGFNMLQSQNLAAGENIEVCIIKHTTSLPCPSCGSTRSALWFFQGNFGGALYTNPFGIVISVFLLFAPFWLLYDGIMKKKSMFAFFQLSERFLSKKAVALPAILIVLANWVWNIVKGL